MKHIAFDVPDEHAPALRSAVEEICDTVALRAHGKFPIPVEHALTRALCALAPLRVAVTAASPERKLKRRGQLVTVPGTDPDYTTQEP